MQNSLRRSWTCARCLLRYQRLGQRSLSTVVTAKPTPDTAPLAATSPEHDDRTLRKIFDSRSFWNDFSRFSKASWTRKSVGLLQNHHLKSPEGFEDFAHLTLEKCRRLVTKVLAICTRDGYIGIVKDLDRLSDLLCRIIDLADFVRSTHPDPVYQQAATQAHALMFEYMNTLNTMTGLNDQLKTAMSDRDVTKNWSEEEMRVAQILRRDFAKSAIDLPAAKRQRFVDLSNTVNELGSAFLDHMAPERHNLHFKSSQLKGVSPVLLRQITDAQGIVTVPSLGGIASHISRFAEDEEVRKSVYIASRSASENQIEVLERLLRTRSELAQLSGFKSYGQMALSDKMAHTPEAVVKFLEALAEDNAPLIREEIESMLKLKKRRSGAAGEMTINAWDRDFYRTRMSESVKKPSTRNPDFIPSYFSLGTVMQGLSRLFSRLYGVRFVPREPQPGETWTPEVRRLDVIDENEGLIAVVYCDLFARAGKSPNPAHFTLRCSRLIPHSEIEEAASLPLPSSSYPSDPAILANDGMASASGPHGSIQQLPTIALICDFPPPANSKTPPLLPTPQLTTLFHEMGHAIHSILGRTKFQNVAGTRCATDFAELPSVLMERFATHPDALALYARHWETDAPLPPQLVEQLQPRMGPDGAVARMADAADEEAQIRLALLDQAFHGEDAGKPGFSTDRVAAEVDARTALVREPREARWHGFFGHLVGYGGAYYAYLFDRAIATRVWDVVFAQGMGKEGGILDRERGEQFRQEVLKWGGGRDGWTCVAGVLGEKHGKGLEGGGEAAMEEVGKWGLGL